MDLREFNNKKVLLITKDKADIHRIREQFSYIEAELEVVKSYQSALEKLDQRKYDHIVLNLVIQNKALEEFMKKIDLLTKENINFLIPISDLNKIGEFQKTGKQPILIDELFRGKNGK